MTKKEKIERIETAIYTLALTSARDNETEKDKEVLKMIKELTEELIKINGGAPGILIFNTIGWTEEEGLEAVIEFIEMTKEEK